MDAFHKAIEDDPSFGLPYSNLGWSYFCQGKFAEAISLYGRSLELLENDKDKAFTWDRLGEAYYQIGNFAKSAEAYQKANELGSNHKKSVVGSSVTLPRQTNSLSGLVSPPTEIDPGTWTQQDQDSIPETPAPGQVENILPSAEETVDLKPVQSESDAKQMDAETQRPDTNGNGGYPISNQANGTRQSVRIPWMPFYISSTPFPGLNIRNIVGQSTAEQQEVVDEGESEEGVQEIVASMDEDTQEPVENKQELVETEVEIQDENQDETLVETQEEETESDQTEILDQESDDVEVQDEDDPDLDSSTDIEIERYERTTGESPNNDRAWSKLGILYKEKKLYDKAVHAFEQASAVDPSNPDYHYQLGTVYTAQKNYDDASLAYERVIELNPENMLAHCALAASYRHLGKVEKAEEHVDIARPSMKDENEYNRACFEAISGNVDEAISLLTIAIENEQTTQEWIKFDPDLDFIREDERFQALLEQPEESELPAQESD